MEDLKKTDQTEITTPETAEAIEQGNAETLSDLNTEAKKGKIKVNIITPGRKSKIKVFDIINYIIFGLLALIIIIPIWKVLSDSFNAVGVYQFKLWPTQPTIGGYATIMTTKKLLRPLINSFVTTILGTLLGLLMATLGGYVLNQEEMPGRNILSYFLLITMIFSGGMIPE